MHTHTQTHKQTHIETHTNISNYYYEMMSISSIIYTTLNCIIWYYGLNFPILCILIHSATCHWKVCMQGFSTYVQKLIKLSRHFCTKCLLVLIMYRFGNLSGHVGLCLENAWLYICSSNYRYYHARLCVCCVIVKIPLGFHQRLYTSCVLHWYITITLALMACKNCNMWLTGCGVKNIPENSA